MIRDIKVGGARNLSKRGHIKFCNLFWGNHLDYFCLKHRSMNHQFYFCGFQAKIIQSTTAITSIVASLCSQILRIVIRLANQLRIKCESMNYQSLRDSATPNRSNPNKIKSARSANPCKSFCYFLLLQKVESLSNPKTLIHQVRQILRFAESTKWIATILLRRISQ